MSSTSGGNCPRQPLSCGWKYWGCLTATICPTQQKELQMCPQTAVNMPAKLPQRAVNASLKSNINNILKGLFALVA